GGPSLRVVGIRNSEPGWLELMWKLRATRKLSSTVPGFPRGMLTRRGGIISTDGPIITENFWPEDKGAARKMVRVSAPHNRPQRRARGENVISVTEAPPAKPGGGSALA